VGFVDWDTKHLNDNQNEALVHGAVIVHEPGLLKKEEPPAR